MKFCPNCGAEVKPSDNVCGNCGQRLALDNSVQNEVKQATPAARPVEPTNEAPRPSQVSRQQVNQNIVQKQKPAKKSMSIFLKVLIGLCITVILACGGFLLYEHFNNNDSQTTQSSSQTKKSSSKSTKAKDRDRDSEKGIEYSDNYSKAHDHSEGYWNSKKAADFDDFFNDWADNMDQDYTRYSGSGSFRGGPVFYPEAFADFDVDGEPVSIGMSKDGTGDNDYNVVAIYNHGNPEFHITYFFTFHNGRPVVLVDQTTNGNRIEATETENQKLKEGFAKIAEDD